MVPVSLNIFLGLPKHSFWSQSRRVLLWTNTTSRGFYCLSSCKNQLWLSGAHSSEECQALAMLCMSQMQTAVFRCCLWWSWVCNRRVVGHWRDSSGEQRRDWERLLRWLRGNSPEKSSLRYPEGSLPEKEIEVWNGKWKHENFLKYSWIWSQHSLIGFHARIYNMSVFHTIFRGFFQMVSRMEWRVFSWWVRNLTKSRMENYFWGSKWGHQLWFSRNLAFFSSKLLFRTFWIWRSI